MPQRISCPVCGRDVALSAINRHLDAGCPEEPTDQSEAAFSSFFAAPAPKSGASASAAAAEDIAEEPPVWSRGRASEGSASNSAAWGAGRQSVNSSPAAKEPSSSASLFAPSRVPPQQKRSQQVQFQRSSQEAPVDDSSGASRMPSSDAAAVVELDSPAAKRQKVIEGGGSLAAATRRSAMPLAERMRPNTLDSIYGQDLVGPNGILRRMIEADSVKSMILWGGPGCGKTTIARTIAAMTKARFVELSGTTNNVADFAPVESGLVTLWVSRSPMRCERIVHLKPLSTESTLKILNRALSAEFQEPDDVPPLLDTKLLEYLAEFASGDARTALNLLEISIQLASQHGAEQSTGGEFTQEDLKKALTRTLVYDRSGDGHYDTISAFHKSVRGNDPDAALYYLGRMIERQVDFGEDPLFISRRMMVIASEDIGLADNSLLGLATATHFAVQNVGMPEARINLAHCTVALCLAKKSTRVYRSLGNVLALLQSDPDVASAPIPLHLRNAPTTLMKNLGYGKEYKYPPNYVDGIVKQEYLPEKLVGRKFLEDRDLGEKIDEDDDAYDVVAEGNGSPAWHTWPTQARPR
ncbi:hypothetical protein DRE_00030 [Drechslerella stenobrocha 248]|uniref:UBZ4-type domain-containing protein n=1 Tax=Drechslerella stenobrocha 248 TaxID=1043628 RepID=W7IHJ4_9PEZI|nr:hypothetical protein DRE_00030 [Drechslerella stenobrocha 248]